MTGIGASDRRAGATHHGPDDLHVEVQLDGQSRGPLADLQEGTALQVLADRPIEQDQEDTFGFRAYADALAQLLDSAKTDTPLTIAISGPWGAGKTSLAQMIERRLTTWPVGRGEPSHITCWFNAWMHDDAPNLGAALAAEVARTADRHRLPVQQLLRPLPSAMLPPQRRWRRRLLFALTALIPAATVAALPAARTAFGPQVGDIYRVTEALGVQRLAGLSIFLFVAFIAWSKLFAVAEAAARFIDDPGSEASKGSMHNVHQELGRLVQQATQYRGNRRRLVIFVDDLERCRPARALEVCEKAHQLLGHPDVATVLIGDMDAVAESFVLKQGAQESGDLAPAQPTSARVYKNHYLEKIVQITFTLPPVDNLAMRQMVERTYRRPPSTPDEPTRSGRPSTPAKDPGLRPQNRLAALLGRPWRLVGWLAILEAAWLFGSAFLQGLLFPDAPAGYPPYLNPSPDLTASLFALLLLLVVFAAVTSARQGLGRLKARMQLARIDSEIKLQSDGTETESSGLTEKVIQQTATDDSYAALVAQQVQRHLVETSRPRIEAEAEIMHHLPALPRGAKQMLNRLRVLLAVSFNRDMLGGEPEVRGSHLGRWVVLQERWPQVARALVLSPDRMAQLEACASMSELEAALIDLVPGYRPSSELQQFLRQGTISLSPVLDRIVRCVPAGSEAGAGSAATT